MAEETPAQQAQAQQDKEDEALAEALVSDRAKLEQQTKKDGAAILIRLARIARTSKDPRIATAAAKEYRVWADGLLGRNPSDGAR